ncbi:unnamed protein product [Adineta ricciae]|uniref:Uncharacterized protein n=1 Tax=Adineta ricciae TaxID=249248 RepID=A0A815UHE4_ADIRI|nr:unnamed protein product [Adineta ricciae]CAF1678733.1 unnamed protein product [Adineta ricciae]
METPGNYTGWSINFILFQGKDVMGLDMGDDELQISRRIPTLQKKHSIAVGSALTVHFAYGSQRSKGLVGRTEYYLLDKYGEVAKNACSLKVSNTVI